jgi:hypothetical protein
MKMASATETAYHRYGAGNEKNEKYTSKIAKTESLYERTWSNRYGRYEIVLRPNGDGTYTHVQEPLNMGTLNRGSNPVDHAIEDVMPYSVFGNEPE